MVERVSSILVAAQNSTRGKTMIVETMSEEAKLAQRQAYGKKSKFIEIDEAGQIYSIHAKEIVAYVFKNNITSVYLKYNNNIIDIPGDHVQTIKDELK
jgi:hypothetical protein